MKISEKAFGLLTEEEQEYMKSFKVEIFNGNSWKEKHNNTYLIDMLTYRIKKIKINNLSELDDFLSQYLSEEFPFVAMDANKEICIYDSKPFIDWFKWMPYNIVKVIDFDTTLIQLNDNIDWKESLLSLHPMTEED